MTPLSHNGSLKSSRRPLQPALRLCLGCPDRRRDHWRNQRRHLCQKTYHPKIRKPGHGLRPPHFSHERLPLFPFVSYGKLFLMAVLSTLFSVQMLTLVQAETPSRLIGKVIALIFTLSTCAQPLGNALYGILFDLFSGREYLAILFSGITSLLIAFRAQILFKKWIS